MLSLTMLSCSSLWLIVDHAFVLCLFVFFGWKAGVLIHCDPVSPWGDINLDQVMAYSLTTQNHYLQLCWLINSGYCCIHMFTISTIHFKITSARPRNHWLFIHHVCSVIVQVSLEGGNVIIFQEHHISYRHKRHVMISATSSVVITPGL